MIKPHILVVDDEPTLRHIASRVLVEAGYPVFQADDGLAALEVMERHADSVQLVVSDIMMPRLNGVELLDRLSMSYPSVQVVLMSGYAPLDLNQRGITAPCGVLAKPFTPDGLLAEVRRCLGTQPEPTG